MRLRDRRALSERYAAETLLNTTSMLRPEYGVGGRTGTPYSGSAPRERLRHHALAPAPPLDPEPPREAGCAE